MGAGAGLAITQVIRAGVTVVTVFVLVEANSGVWVAGIRRTEIPIVTRFRGKITRPVQRIAEIVRTSDPIETVFYFEYTDAVFTRKIASIRRTEIRVIAACVVLANLAFAPWNGGVWLI